MHALRAFRSRCASLVSPGAWRTRWARAMGAGVLSLSGQATPSPPEREQTASQPPPSSSTPPAPPEAQTNTVVSSSSMARDLLHGTAGKRRVAVLGTGWGSYAFLQNYVCDEDTQVCIVSPRNHFLFTPLLPSTTVGTLQFSSVIEPIRSMVPDKGYHFHMGSCTRIEPASDGSGGRLTISPSVQYHTEADSLVDPQDQWELEYDKLLIGIGAVPNTFGTPGVHEHAYFLKELRDAVRIRKRILNLFEVASNPHLSTEQRERLLSIVVVGGGPTGMETAAELRDFLVEDIYKWFPELREYCARGVRVTVVEAGHRVLTAFDEGLSRYATRRFQREEISVRTNTAVSEVHADHVVLSDGEVLPSGLTIWSAGIKAPALLSDAGSGDHHGVSGFAINPQSKRLEVDGQLRVLRQDGSVCPGVYALGDCAHIMSKPLPPTAQVAQQQGEYLATAFRQTAPPDFSYTHRGMMSYIGRYASIIQSDFQSEESAFGVKTGGFLAWLAWRSVYLTKLGSLKNKLQVPYDWTKSLLFGRDISF